MFRSKAEQSLRRLFQTRIEPRPEHRGALEAELLARFDRRTVKTEKVRMSMMKSVVFRRIMVLTAAAVIACAGACVAPADVDVDVGRSVELRYDAATVGAPDPHSVVDLLRGQGEHEEVGVRVQKQGSEVTLRLDMWGSDLGEASLADRIRKAFPALAGAAIKEEKLQGKVRGTVGEKIGHDLFDLDVITTSDVEEAKKQVMAQLAAKGVQGDVDVKVEDDGSKRKVMIRVEKRDGEPPAGAAQDPVQAPSNESGAAQP